MKLTAKQMFEEIGYKDTSNQYKSLIRYELKEEIVTGIKSVKIIEFQDGIFASSSNEFFVTQRYNGEPGCVHITPLELQAINKQIQEIKEDEEIEHNIYII